MIYVLCVIPPYINWILDMTEMGTHDEDKIESHTEGILLFSETQTCYGKPLSDIIDEIRDDIPGYGETVRAEPHADGWETIQLASEDPDAHKHILDNSAWVIHHECYQKDGYETLFKLQIAGFFRECCVIIWADPTNNDAVDPDEIQDTSRFPDKVTVVTSESGLKRELTNYLTYGMNPKTGCGPKIQRWKDRVREKKLDIG